MGIPAYFSHIIKNYNYILKNYRDLKNNNFIFDNLYLDCNSIIYDILNNNKNLNSQIYNNDINITIINQVLEKIEYYIDFIKPRKSVFIAFDGVAPFAKIKQQKQRRFKSYYQNRIIENIRQNNNQEIKNNEEKIVEIENLWNNWSSINITPGTNFMNLLNKECKNYFNKNFVNKHKLKTLYLSGSNIVGEGEHKIFNFIRKNYEKYKEENILIYGLDADLIMLCLNLINICPNLYLYRETPHFIQNLNNNLNKEDNYVLSILDLSYELIIKLSNLNEEQLNKEYLNKEHLNKEQLIEFIINNFNIIQDYIFLCFMLGNDFMPHFPSLNIRTKGIDNLLKCYNIYLNSSINNNNYNIESNNDVNIDMNLYNNKRLINSSFFKKDKEQEQQQQQQQQQEQQQNKNKNKNNNNNIINWNNFYSFLYILSLKEYELIIYEHKLRNSIENKYKNRTDVDEEQKFNNLPIYERNIEKYINPYKVNWEFRYYKSLFKINYNNKNQIFEIILNYLEGLEWNFKYYNGLNIDWRWSYKYYYPPLLCDLYSLFPKRLLNNKNIGNIGNIKNIENININPVSELVQLCYVLPRKNLDLLPQNSNLNNGINFYEKFMEIFGNSYKYDYNFIWAYCKYFWECHVEIDEIDINLLEDFVNKYYKNII